MSIVEWIATFFGLLCVWLTIRQNIWCWPTGLVQVILYVWVFYQARLYSDVILQIIYIGLQIYGWYYWLAGGPRENAVPITRLTPHAAAMWLLVAIGATLLMGYGMKRYTNAALPYWDSAITIMSLIAQYLLSRKILENWLFWIAVDILAVGVYYAKNLYTTTGLYAVFLVMAISGWFAWQRSYKIQRAALGSAPAAV